MKKLLSCEFNIDTACVELKYSDGSMLAIDCDGVEDVYAKTIRHRGALDCAFSFCQTWRSHDLYEWTPGRDRIQKTVPESGAHLNPGVALLFVFSIGSILADLFQISLTF